MNGDAPPIPVHFRTFICVSTELPRFNSRIQVCVCVCVILLLLLLLFSTLRRDDYVDEPLSQSASPWGAGRVSVCVCVRVCVRTVVVVVRRKNKIKWTVVSDARLSSSRRREPRLNARWITTGEGKKGRFLQRRGRGEEEEGGSLTPPAGERGALSGSVSVVETPERTERFLMSPSKGRYPSRGA